MAAGQDVEATRGFGRAKGASGRRRRDRQGRGRRRPRFGRHVLILWREGCDPREKFSPSGVSKIAVCAVPSTESRGTCESLNRNLRENLLKYKIRMFRSHCSRDTRRKIEFSAPPKHYYAVTSPASTPAAGAGRTRQQLCAAVYLYREGVPLPPRPYVNTTLST